MTDAPLSDMQRAVLDLFFALPESNGFVLAGGAALVATGLTARPTQDVDLFGSDLAAGIARAGDALEAACLVRGWTIERIRDAASFRRLAIRSSDHELLVDLAVDSPPLGTPTLTAVGPTSTPASHRHYSPTCCRLISGSPMRTSSNSAVIRSSCERSSIGGGATSSTPAAEHSPI